jgi:hypothetical protein
MTDVYRIRAVKERVAHQLHAIPGVHAVGVGKRVVGGKRTEELAIAVFVLEKKSPEEVPAGEIIPSEIEGIKTDVVEMPRVRLQNANPNSITTSISPLSGGASGGIVILEGTTVPDEGLFVIVDVTVTPATGTARNLCVVGFATGGLSLNGIAATLAQRLVGPGLTATASTFSPAQLTVKANTGFTVQVSRAYVLAEDKDKYFKDFVRGGIRIQRSGVNGWGTLGCLATTQQTPQDPQGKVVALTNYHTVAPIDDNTTNLVATQSQDGLSVTFSTAGGQPVTAGTLVVASITKQDSPHDLLFDAFYLAGAADAPADIAKGIVQAASTVVTGGSINQVPANGPTIALTMPAAYLNCKVSGTPTSDSSPDLSGVVKKTAPTTSVITFSGEVSSADYGIFVSVNPGGSNFSFGAFVNPKKNQSLSDVAAAVSDALNAVQPNTKGTVTASHSGSTVTVNSAQEVECRFTSDIQVGQPDDSFGTRCSRCCSHRIGRILDAQLHADVALIALDPGLKYKLEIQDLTGGLDLSPTPLALDQIVKKRGMASGMTTGTVIYLNLSAEIDEGKSFFRTYNQVLIIKSTSPVPAQINDPFSLQGDSGAAVFSTDSAGNHLVGLLFGGQDMISFATAIEAVTYDFDKSWKPVFSPAPGTNPDTVQIVPKPAALHALEDEDGSSVPAIGIAASLEKRLHQAEEEVRTTALGREFADVLQFHFPEGVRLVNKNRRVAAVWHRSGGPEIFNAVLRVVQFRNERLPAEINGRPFADCLRRIQQVLTRYASPRFSEDLNRYAPRLASFSHMTYPELLASLESGSGD